MSEQEEIICRRIREGIEKAQIRMLERKAKLDESVVYANSDGQPYTISAKEALKRLDTMDRR